MDQFDDKPNYSRPIFSAGLKRKKGLRALKGDHSDESYALDHYRNEILNASTDDDLSKYGIHGVRFEPFEPFTTQETTAFEHVAAPTYSGNASSTDLSKPTRVIEEPPYEDFIRVKTTQSAWQIFVWPAFAICVPIMLLSAALLYIVFRYLVKPVPNIFDAGSSSILDYHKSYLLVNFPATKLVFLASFLSTLAPLLAGCIMSLTAVLVHQELKKTSDVSHFPQLPTPYQMSLLVGVLAASYEQLFNSFGYLLSSKRAAKASPVLLYAIYVFLLSVLLGIAVCITDAYLHVATQTISITVFSQPANTLSDLGKGINSFCLGVDRVKDNYGYPCTIAASNTIGSHIEWQDGQPEIQRIAHNTSVNSTVRLATSGDPSVGTIAFLMPQRPLIPDQTNFMATTMGVATKCSLIPPAMCNTTRWGDKNSYTSFNCSSQFWGTLGMPPTEAAIGSGKAITPYLSFLAINQNANLIYNYFADSALEVVYNTAGLNASARQASGDGIWTDADLQNPVYLGFAWRTATSSFAGFSKNGMVTSGMVQRYKNASYVDFFVTCEVSSYDVEYNFVNGSLQTLNTKKHDNGTVLNMWTGMADYTPSVSGSDFNLQDYNVQSVIAGNSTSSYEERFGELLSLDALSTIGAFTSGRRVSKQQNESTILVAKVPKSALVSLLACSLLYPLLGLSLLIKAKNASRNSGPITPIFSYWGLASAAFLDNRTGAKHDATGLNEGRPCDQEEALRLFIRNDDENGSRFGLYRRSRTGHVTELERSHTDVAAWV